MDKTKTIALAVLIFVFGLSAGLIFGVSLQKKVSQSGTIKSAAETEKACFDQARQRLKDTGIIPNTGNLTEIKSVVGVITNISGNSITLKIHPLEALADPALDNRTIEINGATKIYQMEKIAGTGGNTVKSVPNQTSPAPSNNANANFHYQNKEIAIGGLKTGDNISVSSEANVLDQKNISAKSIYLIPAEAPKN